MPCSSQKSEAIHPASTAEGQISKADADHEYEQVDHEQLSLLKKGFS